VGALGVRCGRGSSALGVDLLPVRLQCVEDQPRHRHAVSASVCHCPAPQRLVLCPYVNYLVAHMESVGIPMDS
jgi:hypothetical protein